MALRNTSLLFSAIHPILVNTYRKPSDLIVGGIRLLSHEGTTQGDPLAMAMYTVATVPLITKITANGCKQICYADDAASGRKLFSIRKGWQQIIDIGAKYGYHPNQSKSWLIVKPNYLNQAQHLFNDTGILITTEGHHCLGTALREKTFCDNFLSAKYNRGNKK